jgi:hypothetical protein
MDSQVKRVRDNRRAGGGGCHRRRRGLREAQDCGCCGALVKKIGVIRATFLTSACQESKMTKEGFDWLCVTGWLLGPPGNSQAERAGACQT